MPIQQAALRAADVLTGALGLLRRPLDPAGLMAAARRHTGLRDFGDTGFVAPLRRLLDACARESDPSLVGRIATRWDSVRFLANLLRLRAEEQADPGILDEPIVQPIFITGLPRSGTTFLHRLLMCDPDNRAPLVWETIMPYPPAPPATDIRPAQVARQLRAFERLAPEFRALHPLDAASPQECSEITAHAFRSLRFDSTYDIPSYRRWLDADGHLDGYRMHRRFLQHLQRQDRRAGRPVTRWVLKCPDHVFALDAIRAVYPDSRIVFSHRDPLKVLLSVARLTEVVRRPFTRRIDRGRIGCGESDRWHEGTLRMMDAADRQDFAEPICHVHHLDLVADPLDTAVELYRQFGITLGAAAMAAMRLALSARPDGGYGPRDYHFADHGLDPARERDRFRPYMVRFGIVPEAGETRRGADGTASVRLPAAH